MSISSTEKVRKTIKIDCGQIVLPGGGLGEVIPTCLNGSHCRNRGTYFCRSDKGHGIYLCGVHKKKADYHLKKAAQKIENK